MAYNYGLAPGTTHKVSPSGSSAASSTAFNADTVFVRVVATAAMNITFAASPTAVATDLYIPAATIEILKVPEQGVKFAAIGTGDCYVTEMS